MADTTHLTGLISGYGVHKKVTVSASKTSGQLVSVENPIIARAIVARTLVVITTPSNVACALDVGTAGTSTDSSNLQSAVGVNMPANTIYDDITNTGPNGTTARYLGPNDFLTVSVASGNANGLVIDFLADIKPFTGGDGARELF